MAYEVTATRRRPQHFDDLVGQEFVAETLKNSIKSGKIAHAFLFSGPRGCGKTSTARILAKALNCQNGPTDNPCGQCSNCQEITKGSSLDVIEIDGASNTSVENIRQIKDEVLFPPSNCRYKIYIIDEVHMLSTSAFNALLKTIEEPPPYVIFIFATTELQKVPATIKSRCQQFNFRLVAIDKVKECLADAAKELNIQAEDEALFWIARESTGSMRDAYTLFDQVVAFSDGHITYEKIRDKLGLVGVERLNTLFEECAKGVPENVINLLDEYLQSGVSVDLLVTNSADYLRSLLLIKSGVTKEALLGNSKERYSETVLNTWNSVQLERGLSMFLQLYRDIRYSLSPRYELELAFSRLCWLSQFVSNTEVRKAIDAAQALLMQGTAGVQALPQNAAGNAAPKTFMAESSYSAAKMPESLPEETVSMEAAEPENGERPSINPSVSANPAFQKIMEKLGSSADYSSGEERKDEHPFPDGGLLPPEKSVEPDVQAQGSRVYEIPSSATGYTENPDEDDGWTNVDEPPEETYIPEEDYTENAEQLMAQEEAAEKTVQAPVQTEENLTTGEGRTISVAQLRGTVTADLSVVDGFIVSALEKTGLWNISDTEIKTTIASGYEYFLLEKNNRMISEEISKVCGRKMQFSLQQIEEEKPVVVKKEIPPQVSMLVEMFKGQIIGR